MDYVAPDGSGPRAENVGYTVSARLERGWPSIISPESFDRRSERRAQKARIAVGGLRQSLVVPCLLPGNSWKFGAENRIIWIVLDVTMLKFKRVTSYA